MKQPKNLPSKAKSNWVTHHLRFGIQWFWTSACQVLILPNLSSVRVKKSFKQTPIKVRYLPYLSSIHVKRTWYINLGLEKDDPRAWVWLVATRALLIVWITYGAFSGSKLSVQLPHKLNCEMDCFLTWRLSVDDFCWRTVLQWNPVVVSLLSNLYSFWRELISEWVK